MAGSRGQQGKSKSAPRRRATPGERKSRGLLSVAASLPKIAAPALRRRGFAEARLITDWPAIVGEMLARETMPQKLVFPRGSRTDATLHLRVAPGFALELQHLAPQVVDRINAFFGFRAVAGLRYLQGPLPPRESPRRIPRPSVSDAESARLESGLTEIEDEGLRAALRSLGRSVGSACTRR